MFIFRTEDPSICLKTEMKEARGGDRMLLDKEGTLTECTAEGKPGILPEENTLCFRMTSL